MERNRIDENIALITEMLSISDEVVSVANNIFNDIQKNYNNYSFKKKEDYLYEAHATQQYNLWGYNIKVEFNIYEFTNSRAFTEKIEEVPFHNGFVPITKTLNLTMVFVYGSLYKNFGGDSIYHEIEHIYQWAMGKNNNPNFKGLVDAAYGKAMEVIEQSSNITERRIAWIIYYSNPHEQDAFAHEYYKQCQVSFSKFLHKKTAVDRHYSDFEKGVKWLERNFNTPNVQSAMKRYRNSGYSPKNILYYAKKGLERFHEKLERVKWRIMTICENPMPFICPKTGRDYLNENNLNLDVEKVVDKIIKKIRKRS